MTQRIAIDFIRCEIRVQTGRKVRATKLEKLPFIKLRWFVNIFRVRGFRFLWYRNSVLALEKRAVSQTRSKAA